MLPPFDLQPTLCGATVALRPLQAEDFDALYAVASDPELWAQHPASDRWQRPVFQRLFDESLASGGALVVIDRAASAVIGSSRFHLADPASRRAEIGWSWLACAHWGGRTNAEVKALQLAHAFRFVDIVQFRVGETNRRSRRAMEKIGGVLTAAREQMTLPNGTPAVHVIYEIAKADFVRSAGT